MEPRAAPSDVEAEMPRGDLEAAMTGDAREAREAKEAREAREAKEAEAKEARKAKDARDAREAKDAQDAAFVNAQIQIGIQRGIERFLHDNGTGTLAAGATVPAREPPAQARELPTPPAQPVVDPYLAFMPSVFSDSGPDRNTAAASRLQARREHSAPSYTNLYSSDRRRGTKQMPEAASRADAGVSLLGSTELRTSSAVGLDTRELSMMSSLRVPGINGLI